MATLKSAVQAVYDKAQANLATATPEELAYISTALDRIGGRATIYDIMDAGDDKIAEINALAVTLQGTMNTDYADALTNFQSSLSTTVTNSQNTIDTSVVNAQTTINNTVSAAETTLNVAITNFSNEVTQAESDISAASTALTSAAAIAQQQALDGTLFNLYFFSTMK